jgi:hypothetical protein
MCANKTSINIVIKYIDSVLAISTEDIFINGINAFRTHANSAHGAGRMMYNIKPRCARLTIHSTHTLKLFVLETWDERKPSNK